MAEVLGFLDAVPLAADRLPQPPQRPELRVLLDEADAGVHEERDRGEHLGERVVVDLARRLHRVEHVTAEIEEAAWGWLLARSEREYSFVDATSFALMRKRKLHEVLAFDDDFTAAGFVQLRP
jgi:predicted nucleic acid-binding protein